MTSRSKDQELIDELVAQMSIPDVPPNESNGHARPAKASTSSSGPSDKQVIEKCRAAENAGKFSDLFDRGDVNAHHGGDDSVADQALLGIMAFYTQDEAQLERLFSYSALGQRQKWRLRDDYREKTICKALAQVGEAYDWGRARSRSLVATSERPSDDADEDGKKAALPYKGKVIEAASMPNSAPNLIRFAHRPAPGVREFLIYDLIPRYYPTTLYGWGGTAKSLIALMLSMRVAGGQDEFLDRAIAVHGPVLYIDFELDPDEQHRRTMQLADGMKAEVPEDLLYISALGERTHEAISCALSACEEHKVVLVVLDSLGPAMVGDMAAAKDVIESHNRYIAPFKPIGATPILVDHQARKQVGEGYQSKGAFGSAYIEHLSRSLIQVERGDQSAEQGTLNVRLRHKKTNFGALVDPFDVALSFSDEMIGASTREQIPADLAQEATLNAEDRIVAALEDGPAYPDEIAEATSLVRGTVKNKVTALKKAGRVETTGETRSQMERLRLVAPRHRLLRGVPPVPPLTRAPWPVSSPFHPSGWSGS